jgi:hypothetical protein
MTNVHIQKHIEGLFKDLVHDLYWEYDKMGADGKKNLDKIAALVGIDYFPEDIEEMMKKEKK